MSAGGKDKLRPQTSLFIQQSQHMAQQQSEVATSLLPVWYALCTRCMLCCASDGELKQYLTVVGANMHYRFQPAL